MNIQEPDKISIFFVVGKGRSGTTLLRSILDVHPQLCVPFESRFLIHLYSKYASVKSWNTSVIQDFIDDLFTERLIHFWHIKKGQLLQDLMQFEGKLNFANAIKIVCLNYISTNTKTKIESIGIKIPINTLFIPEIKKAFPEVKFIHMIRDYRDSTLSQINTFQLKDIAFDAHKWLHFNKISESIKVNDPARVLVVKYESLAADPENEVKKVCNFLNVDYKDEMLNFHIKKGQLDKADDLFYKKFHPELFTEINTKKVNKWEQQLTDKQVQLLDYIAGDFAAQYGYQRKFKSASLSQKITSFKGSIKYYLWRKAVRAVYQGPLWLRLLVYRFFDYLYHEQYKDFKKIIKKEENTLTDARS